MKKIIYSLKEIDNVLFEIQNLIDKFSVFLFFGQMGSGKTTLIKKIMDKLLQIKDLVNSPTYSYMNKYFSKKFKKNIYHFDLYRLKNFSEIIELGLKEFLIDENSIIFIEWPEIILDEKLFDKNKICIIELNYKKINNREILIKTNN